MTEEFVNVMVPQGQGGYSMPQPLPQLRSDLIDKIKPEHMVEVIRERLLGNEFVGGEWKPVKALENKRLTPIGAWEISNLMLGVSSINISISKLSDREIKERLFRIAKTSMILMLSNFKEYGVTNASQFDYVYDIVFSNTLGVLKQADNASIQELMKATVYESRTQNVTPKETLTGKISRMVGLSG